MAYVQRALSKMNRQQSKMALQKNTAKTTIFKLLQQEQFASAMKSLNSEIKKSKRQRDSAVLILP